MRFGIILLMVIGGMSSLVIAQEPADFRGNWDMEETGGLAFGLELQQEGNTVFGHHCGMLSDASRIDCSLAGEDDPTITGSIAGNVAKVRFTSAYSGQIGMAKLTRQDESLLWEITAYPNGVYYLPDQAVLTKTGDSSIQSSPSDERLERLHALVTQDLQTQSYAYPVRLDERHIVYDDMNADNYEDIAAIFYPFDESIDDVNAEVRMEDRFLAIGFGNATGELTLVLNAQGVPCLSCGGVYGEPELSLTSDNGVLALSSYGGSNWRWEQIQKIRYEAGSFKVIGYTENSYHIGAGISLGYDVNLNTLEAVRSFDYGEGDDQKGEARFTNLMANYANSSIIIDGVLNETTWMSAQVTTIRNPSAVVYKPENWSGASDLSFSAVTVWDADGLYLGIAVEDERVVPVESWERILKGDHLELWLDCADSSVRWDADGWPLRQKPDGNLMQIGVGVPDSGTMPIIRILYPEEPKELTDIVAAASQTPTGYVLEIRIPLTMLEVLAPADPEWEWMSGLSFGFSLIISDTDDSANRRQDCLMATSEVKWGNPSTFGTCYLVETYAQPTFPLREWRIRY